MKAALMREYHRPLELVDRPVPEPRGTRTSSSASAPPASAPPTSTRSTA